MQHASHTKVGAVIILSLFTLLAIAAGAQAALAAHLSLTSPTATQAAGTEGRGGVSLTVVATTPGAGTQGRGGIDVAQIAAVAGSGPSAGTQGRGGIAGTETSSTTGTVSPARGVLPAAQVGIPPAPSSTASPNSEMWPALALAAGAIALVAGFSVWAASRRRAWQAQSSLAAFCAYNPRDTLCKAG